MLLRSVTQLSPDRRHGQTKARRPGKKNAAKSGGASKIPKGFGKKYDGNLSDDPTDEATIKQRAESERFFAEMKKRDF